MSLTVGFAFATSHYASKCGASETGCYIVTRDHNIKTGELLKSSVLASGPFKTRSDAETWAKGWEE